MENTFFMDNWILRNIVNITVDLGTMPLGMKFLSLFKTNPTLQIPSPCDIRVVILCVVCQVNSLAAEHVHHGQ